ncbi:MAG: hypothetical protein EBU01_17100 [Crocinitomicaceae bacterium]|nr:hypothetical protein [Crocinitomicaceae bacterium]
MAANADVFVTGVQAVGEVGSVLIWSNIIPGPTGPWTVVNDAQAGGWTPVDDSQTNIWTPIAA